MTFFGIGTDIIEIGRIAQAIDRRKERFVSYIFTIKEIEYCNRFKNPIIHYAGRFAAKEAVAKALGIGIVGSLFWRDIEILPNAQGKPEVFLSERTQEHFPPLAPHLSISHCREYAMATCIIFS